MPIHLPILRALAASALVLGLAGTPGAAMAQGQARITCRITENGQPASGTVRVSRGGREVGSGACGAAIAVSPGSYSVAVQLDGALDRPAQTRQITVGAGAAETVAVDFETGILEVTVTAAGRRAAGMAVVSSAGRRIGTLGSGVGAHVGVGTYDVVVTYRGQERRFAGVTVARGQRIALSAEF